MQNWKLRVLSHLAGAWEFRWYGLAAAFVACFAGWLGVALIPNTFESSAEVYIDTDTLLRPLLKGLAVTTDTDQEVSVMLRTLLSTPNLERVVRATDSTALNASRLVMQDKIDALQSNVTLANLGTANLYTISFKNRDPRYAQSVAQALLSVLIDTNLGSQRRDSDSVRTFLENQIEDYEQKLTQADKRRADFKAAHIGFFSSGADGAVEVGGGVVQAMGSVTQAQTALGEATARRDSLRGQLGTIQSTLDVAAPATIIVGGSQGGTDAGSQMSAAQARLSDLRTRYTENYPDIVATEHLISRLQSQIGHGHGDGSGSRQGISNPAYVAIRSKLADEEANVAVDQERLANAQKNLDVAKQDALEALSVQRDYESLNRDYQVQHTNYEELVTRRESANISQAAGSQQSAIFRVIDPPVKPDRPTSPNRLLLNVLVLLAGLSIGTGVSLALNEFYGRFVTAMQMTEAFSLPSLGTVTIVDSTFDMEENRRSMLLFASGVGVLLLSYLIVLILFHSHVATLQSNTL